MDDLSIYLKKCTQFILVGGVLISFFIYAGGQTSKCKVAPHAVKIYTECSLIFGTNATPVETWNAKELEVANEVMKQVLACYSVEMNLTDKDFIIQDDFLIVMNSTYEADDQVRKQFMDAASICKQQYDNRTKDGTWAVMNCVTSKRIQICGN